MHTAQIIATSTKSARRMFAALALVVVAVALLAAGPAHADPKQGGGGSGKGCPVENDGKVETVPVGSKVGLFTCGSDGEWHFGWLVSARTLPPRKSIKPITTAAIRHGVLQAAIAGR